MRKKTGIRNLVLLGILIVLGLVLTFVSFNIPYTTNTFVGFAKGVRQSYDIGNGVQVTLNTSFNEGKESTYNDDFDYTSRYIDGILKDNFNVYELTNNGKDGIIIKLPYTEYNVDFLTIIGQSHNLVFKDGSEKIVMNGSNIKSIYPSKQATQSGDVWGVVIEYDNNAKKELEKMTEDSQLDIYLDDEKISSMKAPTNVEGNALFINGGMKNKDDALMYASRLMTGKYTVKVLSNTPDKISASYGRNTMLFISIATLVSIIITIIVLGLVYGWLGVAADCVILMYLITYTFMLSVIPDFILTLGGFITSVMGLTLLIVSMIIILERIKKEYATGKKLNASVKAGFKKALAVVLDLNSIVALASILCIILGKGETWLIGVSAITGACISAFMSLLVLRAFVSNIVAVSKKSKGLGMSRAEGVDEIA